MKIEVKSKGLIILPEEGYELIFSHVSGGIIFRHTLVNIKCDDYPEVFEVAMDKAILGCIVHILPIINPGHLLREKIFAGAKERKCPDMKINGEYTEVKTPKDILHPNKINNNIKFAYNQADDVIIRLHSEFDIQRLRGIAKGRFLSHANLKLLEFKMNGQYFPFRRSDFI